MNQETWRNHIQRRSDFTTRLTHLTRRTSNKRAIEVLYEILDSKTIIGSTNDGFINGSEPAVCFQDLPLFALAENVKFEDECFLENHNLYATPRYEAFGVRFNKGTLFQKYTARPVVYGPKEEMKTLLQASDYWRWVTLDYSDSNSLVDWTHEREWRVRGNVVFSYSDVEVILGCSESYREFVQRYMTVNPELLQQIQGIIVLNSIIV